MAFEVLNSFDSTQASQNTKPETPEQARQLLICGNRDFVRMTDMGHPGPKKSVVPFNPRAVSGVVDGKAPRQAPFAAVLGCSDARVPTELVFNRSCNELFVVRVAGNVLGQECLGSLRYAVSHFPATLKLLVVLGHSQCGAVTEAVNLYLEPGRYLEFATDYSLRSVEDHILVAVRVAAMSMESLYGVEATHNPDNRAALLEAAVVLNAAWTAYCLQQEFRAHIHDLGIVFGSYDLSTRRIRVASSSADKPGEEEQCLLAPPRNAEEFRALAIRMCSGKLARKLHGRAPVVKPAVG